MFASIVMIAIFSIAVVFVLTYLYKIVKREFCNHDYHLDDSSCFPRYLSYHKCSKCGDRDIPMNF